MRATTRLPTIDNLSVNSNQLTPEQLERLEPYEDTLRSNLTVGLPIDLLVYERNTCKITLKRRFMPGDRYVTALTAIWSAGLRRAFTEVPPVPWVDEET